MDLNRNQIIFLIHAMHGNVSWVHLPAAGRRVVHCSRERVHHNTMDALIRRGMIQTPLPRSEDKDRRIKLTEKGSEVAKRMAQYHPEIDARARREEAA